jgi:hypothetical protein
LNHAWDFCLILFDWKTHRGFSRDLDPLLTLAGGGYEKANFWVVYFGSLQTLSNPPRS